MTSPATRKMACAHDRLSAEAVARVLAKLAAPAAANATTAPLSLCVPDKAVERLPYFSAVWSAMHAAWVAAAAAFTKASFARSAAAAASADACCTERVNLTEGRGIVR